MQAANRVVSEVAHMRCGQVREESLTGATLSGLRLLCFLLGQNEGSKRKEDSMGRRNEEDARICHGGNQHEDVVHHTNYNCCSVLLNYEGDQTLVRSQRRRSETERRKGKGDRERRPGCDRDP